MDKSKLTESVTSANQDDEKDLTIITETAEHKATLIREMDSGSLYADKDRGNHYFLVY
jgi:hypothetical protein